ncbi:MAG TPA: cytochrome c peroxidase [Mangrovimonas sp.]|nr:cytochrome c peroxidase [Mangrovimonas sp.]
MPIKTNHPTETKSPKSTCLLLIPSLLILTILNACNSNSTDNYQDADPYPNISAAFGNTIELDNLPNYVNQTVPNYITKNNSLGNSISNEIATLGRVLFYDVNLSVDNTVSCATCHQQSHGFSDTEVASNGVNGQTVRHSMRLINVLFSDEVKFFWDERAETLEAQTTMPIKDHGEMGFSGENGDLSFEDLLEKLNGIGYYNELFTFAFGNSNITEDRIQQALSQFVRSIQSFDTKYDEGRAQAGNDGIPFSNFTMQENQGKNLFLAPPQFDGNGSRIGGGIGCAGCHTPPEFSIEPNTLNNGIIGVIGSTSDIDINNTKAPTLRELFSVDGSLNGPFMHTGAFVNLQQVMTHYDNIIVPLGNTNIDPKLLPQGNPQQLNLTTEEINSVIAFLRTLSGTDVYTNTKWSNPFE